MKTILRSYYFDCSNADQAAAYKSLTNRLKGTHGRGNWMKSLGGGSHYNAAWLEGIEIELDAAYLFDNQWNTVNGCLTDKGYRVFDWAEDALFLPNGAENKTIRRGHYLEITNEMRDIRRNTHKCGFCGKIEPAVKGYAFCPHCRASEYMKEKDLYLTRMMPVDTPFNAERAQLTDAESTYLIPLWRDDQITGNSERGKARMEKARANVQKRFDDEIRKATFTRDVANCCLDNGMMPEIAIAYDHTGRVCFGWNKPVDSETLSKLLDLMPDFPWPYDIKCADGKVLSGG